MNISGYNPLQNRPNPYSVTKSADPATSTFGSMIANGSTSSPAVTVSISAEARAALASSSLSSVQTRGPASFATTNPASFIYGGNSTAGASAGSFDIVSSSGDSASSPVLIDAAFFQKAHAATFDERQALYADAARSISASQGMPEGHYDFTRLTPNQMLAINNDLIVNKGTEGLSFSMPGSDPSAPELDVLTDYISATRSAYEFCSSFGATEAAKSYKNTLELMAKFGSQQSE
ncbi:hypothetical protein C8J31_1173 [Rhizobium sp. PP-CC-2G-626]|nr:hypothetical protein C8J31_1173 [Rhizobium sp. PP-CC-2G-626]